MTISLFPFRQVSDAALLAQVRSLATAERQATAQLIAALAELDTRRSTSAKGAPRSSPTARTSCIFQSTPPTDGSRPGERHGDFQSSSIC